MAEQWTLHVSPGAANDPVFVGVGEGVDDLRPFEAKAFADALLGLDGMD